MIRFSCLAFLLLVTSAVAEVPEGETLEIIDVEAGWGDGRITERDSRAFCEFCLWGVNRLRADIGDTDPIEGDEAIERMRNFWIGVWEHVDPEIKQTISAADVLWPAIQERLAEPGFADSLAMEFEVFADDVWGGYELETVAYLDGSLPPFSYEQVVSERIDEMLRARARTVGRGGGVVPSFSPYGDDYRDDIGTSYEIFDGSGDIMYIDE